MKKILVIHTNYQTKGGEDIAVENEINFLNKNYNVESLIFSNKQVNSISTFFAFFTKSNAISNSILKKKLDSFNPDLIYIHNTWFKSSLGIFNIIKKRGIPTIVKLHNYRYLCASSFGLKGHFEKNGLCMACGMILKNKKFNKYYENSIIKSIFLILFTKKYFKILQNYNLKIFVLTSFHSDLLKKRNILKNNIYVFPNYISANVENYNLENKNSIVYAGRVSKEKGVENLIETFNKLENHNLILEIIGTGPDYRRLKKRYSSNKINFVGEISNVETLNRIRNSKAVVTATHLYEGQPTLLCEASSLGKISIFPQTGGIGEFFPKNYKYSFEQFNYDDLKNKLTEVSTNNDKNLDETENKEFLQNYLSEKKLFQLFEGYTNE